MNRLDRLAARLAAQAPREAADPGRREAAVALLLLPSPDRLLLIRRADRLGDPWSGHLALPGGRREPADGSLLDTAIRETHEEVGVALAAEQQVAQLDDLAPTTPALPPIIVRPFVFRLGAEPAVRANAEVAAHHWVRLEALAAADAFGPAELDLGGVRRRVHGYALPGGLLWGMTERILTPVVRAWADVRRDED
jgi:8-oxo-dGTP pyrophosphatase MutT (NUDIX family)